MNERDLIEIRSQIDSVCEASDDQYDKWHADRGVTTSRAKWKARALAAEATIARLSEALAEAEKKGAEDWQPIETAPRDGTEVILYFPTYATAKVGVYRWRDVTGPEWEGIDGWSWDAKLGEVEDVPTHWRPLPAPPRDLSQGGQHG